MKLLFFILIVYLAYRAGKAWIGRNLSGPSPVGASDPSIDDVMIKDPICGVYFPRREGIEVNHHGQILVFCSTACRDRFLEQQK